MSDTNGDTDGNGSGRTGFCRRAPRCHDLSPVRIADTRPDTNVGPHEGTIGAGAELTYSGRGTSGECVLPQEATALSLNVTAIRPTTTSFYTVYPTGTERPLAAHPVPLGPPGPPITENGVEVKLSDDGELTVFNNVGESFLAIDVLGVHVPGAGGGEQGPAGPEGPAGPAGPEKELFAPDPDGDGWGGTFASWQLKLAVTAPPGYAPNGDCAEGDPNVNPDAAEIDENFFDDNCDGVRRDRVYTDADGDFWGTGAGTVIDIDVNTGPPAGQVEIDGDCDDSDPGINPGAFDVPGDGVDQNCDGVNQAIEDNDGDGDDAAFGSFSFFGQCDDGLDNDGDGDIDDGADSDCESQFDAFEGDCDDSDPSVFTGAAETPGDFIDSNCNGADDT